MKGVGEGGTIVVFFGEDVAKPGGYLSNEQSSVPLVVRSAIGGGGRFGAIHSQVPISWFQGCRG
jgi:hypothetical protein